MDYRASIQAVIDLIEEQLYEEIDTERFAAYAGYSYYHFQRIFTEVVGMSPACYIRRRRLTEIVRRMYYDDRPIYEIAFACGFNSREHFCRAFLREHHIHPQDYRRTRMSLRLYDRVVLDDTFPVLTPRIVVLSEIPLLVYQSDEAFPPHFWNRYNAEGRSARLSGGAVCEDYGVSLWDNKNNRLHYAIGIRTEDAHGDTADTVPLTLSGGLYAVFETPRTTHLAFVDVIRRTWDYILNTWLPQSEYRTTDAPPFEVYTEKSRTFCETIYIPITEKENNR
ncbi:MAG: AraC family transcriptional regulator [Clostridia bacterium]|nr:AraC family transcriptional regulator [Clostridia bacterium]